MVCIMSVQQVKLFLQVMYGDGIMGKEVQHLERASRTMTNIHKAEKKRPKGGYIKLLITHTRHGAR